MLSPGFFPHPNDTQATAVYDRVLSMANVTDMDNLAKKNATELMAINAKVVHGSSYGQFTFGPTVDVNYDLPSKRLMEGTFNNKIRVYLGYTALDGLLFTPPWVRSTEKLKTYIRSLYKGVTDDVLAKIASFYQIDDPANNGVKQRQSITAVSNALNVGFTTFLENELLVDFP